MNLAIVDIDGTLTKTTDIDAECYIRVVSAFLRHSFPTDWLVYVNVTDSGILEELCREYLGRSPTASEIDTLESAFVFELGQAFREKPSAFAPIPGASEFLERAPAAGWQVALATGAWSGSAKLKLEAAGLPTDLPIASGSDSLERQAIVRHAIHRAIGDGRHDERIVLVGDAPWDLETAKQLKFPFVGIASGGRAEHLRAAGASHVFPDFRDLESFFAALGAAGVP